MPTVNGPDEITDLEAGNDKVFYSDSSGNVTEVALGAAATVLTSAGATSAPTFSAIPADPTVGANKTMYTNNSDVESGLAFGAAGTVLTSGGTDATATPPTWATPTGGQEVTLTADGAITAGKVVASSSGKAVQIASNTSAQAIGGGNTGVTSTASAGTNCFGMTYDPDNSWSFHAMQWYSSGYAQLKQNNFELTGTAASSPAAAPTNNSLYDIDSSQSYGSEPAGVSCTYDTTNNNPIVVYRNLSQYLEVRAMYRSGVNTYYSLNYSSVVYSGAIGACTAVVWKEDTSQLVIFFQLGTELYVTVGDVSTGSFVASSYQSQVDAGVNADSKFNAVWDSDEEVAIVIYSNGSSGMKARAFEVTSSGATSNVTGGTAVSFGGSEFPDKVPAIAYDPQAKKTYALCNAGSGNYFLSGHITASGTTLTASTLKNWSGDTSMGSAGQYLGPARATSGSNIYGAAVAFSNYGASQHMYYGTVAYRTATDDVFWKEAPAALASTVSYGTMVTYDPVKAFGCVYYIDFSAGGTLGAYYIPNKDSELGSNILGIAQSTVADGQSVTISMAGSSYTTSGLTAGSLYYAASNGDPSTTAGRSGTLGSPFAIAKSTTELLVMRQVFGDTA